MMEDNNRQKIIYSALPWHKKMKHNIALWYEEKILGYRFPWKKLIVFLVIVLFIGMIYVAVKVNQVTVDAPEPYDKSGFTHAEDVNDAFGDTLMIETDHFRFELDTSTTRFVLTDKTKETTWASNPDEYGDRFLHTFIVRYAGSLGQTKTIGVHDQAVEYDDYYIKSGEDFIDVLYEIGGKKEIDSSDFPPVITDERMQELILDELEEGSISYRRVTEQAYVSGTLEGEKIWKLKDGIQSFILTRLYDIMYGECGYTQEDLEKDLEMHGIVLEDRYPYFELAVRYEISDQGFNVRVLNDSFTEKEKFPMIAVDVLPYFGAGSETDDGYMFVPDGSGGLIEFNNDRSFALPYNQRIYGRDYAVFTDVMPADVQEIRLPVIGTNHDGEGFISVASEGAGMASVHASIASADNPYNQVFYRYHIREKDVYDFSSINSSVSIDEWTPWYNTDDLYLEYLFVEDESDYAGMAHTFRTYLDEKGMLPDKDDSLTPVFNLTLLGGYEVTENFLGIPYTTVRTLTNTEEALKIAEMLKNDGIDDLNLIYRGFSNEGVKPTYMGSIDYDRRTGNKRDFRKLSTSLQDLRVGFYPEISLNTAYTDSGFNENNDAVRDVFGHVVYNHAFNPASLLPDDESRRWYTLQPDTYLDTLHSLFEDLSKIDVGSVAYNDFGSQLYGTYDNRETLFRTDTERLFHETMEHAPFSNQIFRNPNVYAFSYAHNLLDVPLRASDYQIITQSVPFYQLVFSGRIDYSGASFNIEDEYVYQNHVLKALETGANIAFTWSHDTTIDLVDTEYSIYYSTFYENWYDMALTTYQDMVETGVFATYLLNHEILTSDGKVTRSTYANGMEIIFNYRLSAVNIDGTDIGAMDFEITKEES